MPCVSGARERIPRWAGLPLGTEDLHGTFRLCHYAVLNDHLHLICEAANRTALARGLQGLLIRIAKHGRLSVHDVPGSA